MHDEVPSPIPMLEPADPPSADRGSSRADAAAAVPELVRVAARRLLARDGRDLVLQPWQAAWLIATSEGREGFVPPACGIGRGWLQARLDEEVGRGG
jgi:hypothetical protein